MKYMLCWSIDPENYNSAIDNFLSGGAPVLEAEEAATRASGN